MWYLEQIVDNGYAYRVEGDVFFSVENFPDYGQLSGRKLEDNRAGERVAVDSRERNPADFALWKASFLRYDIPVPCMHNILSSQVEDMFRVSLMCLTLSRLRL